MTDEQGSHNIASPETEPAGLVSVVIPHYETPELAKLCLRAIRRFTRAPCETIIIDNASADGASLAYLRTLRWIRLIERPAGEVPPDGPAAHATALDIGLREARGEFLLIMHTDTIARREGWLGELLAPFRDDPKLAVVGADKLDAPGPLWEALKSLVDGKTYRRLALRLAGRTPPGPPRRRPPHARSCCALYRRDVLVAEQLSFLPTGGSAAGEETYRQLLARGYHGQLLPPDRMRGLVAHVVHATALLSPVRAIRTPRVRRRTARRVRRLLAEPWVRALLEDDSLDRP